RSVADFAADTAQAVDRGRSRHIRNLVVVRDPFNWLASQMKAQPSVPLKGSAMVERWKGHVRECLGQTRILPHLVPINFSRWVADVTYRQFLSRELGLEFRDAGFREVELPGLSSFDTEAVLEDNAVVLGRWKSFIGDETYRSLFDSELLELSDEFFGFNPLR